jgi:acyl carrier protein
MTNDEALAILRSVLRTVAPEADLNEVGKDETIQEALDLDSIDFLNLVIGIHERTGLEIPERDYPELTTVDGFVDYLSRLTVS